MKTITVELTKAEINELLWAVSNFTGANGNDLRRMRSDGVAHPKVLIQAEHMLHRALGRGDKLNWK